MNEHNPSVRNLLEKAGRVQASTPPPKTTDETEGDYSAYAHGRISRHTQLTLMFRFADGSVRAFAYAYLCGAESPDPNIGFVLDFSQHKVGVTGRNLEKLLRLICQHRVAEIREADRSESFSLSEDVPIVESIDVKKA